MNGLRVALLSHFRKVLGNTFGKCKSKAMLPLVLFQVTYLLQFTINVFFKLYSQFLIMLFYISKHLELEDIESVCGGYNGKYLDITLIIVYHNCINQIIIALIRMRNLMLVFFR